MKLNRIIFISLIVIMACSSTDIVKNNNHYDEYDFHKPDLKIILPDTLREISGLAILNDYEIACIQDENGIVFIYNLISKEITKQIAFFHNGDYEGICLNSENIYVLKSDGVLFEILNFRSEKPIVNSYNTGIPAQNNEGLCFDKTGNRILIACKSKIGKGAQYKDLRVVYSFDIQSKRLSKEPVYSFNLQDIQEFADDKGISLPDKKTKKGDKKSEIKFRPSEINIHPITNDIYILSAVEQLLFVFKYSGELKHIQILDSELFLKPEGIDFFKNGDMLISNEAEHFLPIILRFNYIEKNEK